MTGNCAVNQPHRDAEIFGDLAHGHVALEGEGWQLLKDPQRLRVCDEHPDEAERVTAVTAPLSRTD